MDELITAEQAIKGLRLAVADRGRDYIDPNVDDDCRYVVDDQPGCIAGTALHKIGVPLETLAAYEGNAVRAMIPGERVTFSPTRGSSITDEGGILTRDAGEILNVAQQLNDSAHTWGTCLNHAEERYGQITWKPQTDREPA